MAESRFAFIFAPELRERLLWFIKLRWLAVAGLVAASMVGPRIGMQSVWPSLFLVALFVAGYNLFFLNVFRVAEEHGQPYGNLRNCAIRQMVMDLLSLIVTVHFSGGLQSPLLPVFAFHMAIGTIMIATRIMYVLAAATSVGLLGLYVAECKGLLAFHPVDPARGMCGRACNLNLVALTVALFGIVYLTDSVTSRFKKRNIELYRTTGKLQERTTELQCLLDEIAELEQRKSHYMRISAHQLRSPLGTVQTTLSVLAKGYVDPVSERGRRLLAGAIERVDGLLAIVNDLLELAKIREGRGRAPWSQSINVNQLLADIMDALEPLAAQKNIELVPDFNGVAILEWGIPPDLVNAFENLVQNAIKYSHHGGVITVRLQATETAARVQVVDHGIGIPEAFRDQVLLEFVRAPNAKRHAPEGTGLGLAIVREVFEAHGGRVNVESEEGAGSTFTVELPLHFTPPEARRSLQMGNEGGYRPQTEPASGRPE